MSDAPLQSGAGAAPEDAVIDCVNLRKEFVVGKRRIVALDGATFRAPRGKVTGLIGPDAAGKTTLMRLAAGLLVPNDGRLVVLGHDASHESLTAQSLVGYMPQRFGLYEDLSVRENLDLYADLQGVPPQDRPPRYDELMQMTGLGNVQSRLAGRLSGGMKQKLGLACTLVRSPTLLLLDEPTVGVDPVSRRELWVIVYRLVREEGMSVLLSTAYLDEAQRCDEVVMLHEGRLLGHGPPSAFSDRVRGRTFVVGFRGMKKRHAQERLATSKGLLDAVIQGDHVRIVTREPTAPDVADLLAGARDVRIEVVEPRFEDSFVDALIDRRGRRTAEAAGAADGISHEAAAGSGPVIEVDGLQRRFGDFYAVKGVTFRVERGEIFGLLGANGAGKTTTFRMLCGLLPPSAGHLRVAGMDLRHAAAAARERIGYMSQKFSLYGNLSIRENLRFFSSAYHLWGRRQRDRVAWALEQFDLAERADMPSSDLPLGYKQRLAMACALMHEPDILFLDEPTSGVDPLARREFWSRINRLADRGVTVMVTTHFMEEAEYCDRLAIMVQGEIPAIGTPAEIRRGARSVEHPDPTMEDAFIHLVERPVAAKEVDA